MGVEALIEQLKTIPDWRRGRTVQYPLWLMLLLSLLGVMSGYSSLRGLEDFMKRHQQEVAELFGLSKAKLPSYSTLRDMSLHINPQDVAQVFLVWVKQAVSIEAGQVVSMDGKALASTVEDGYGQQQDFVSVISACVQQWDGVIGQLSFQNGKTSEIVGVRQLLKQLNLKGVWVTLDALHTQKNGESDYRE
ncbi:ISAs1 family transposase [Kovacikia minuta CCNUW1]|uniref:ISAs1 family transposase n=1 Tax=Kovacikia minuta TaxID=2931930 RepID=UPI001CCC121D|nr:ISAs1 family transposase [Kovacikia minuta]UBF28943.1 ISAs1 family transposase [Kovacikia minuta CCNUW1]